MVGSGRKNEITRRTILVFPLVCKGVLLCSQHCAAGFCLGVGLEFTELPLTPSLLTHRSQGGETFFCLRPLGALGKIGVQRNFPQMPQVFPFGAALDAWKKNRFSARRYPASLKEQVNTT